MSESLPKRAFCAGFFSDVASAERAIAELLAAGYSKTQLGIICPEKFRKDFSSRLPREETPAEMSPARIAAGASIGAVLGGIALAATTLATGGTVLVPGALVLVGGGALAGGIANLIVSDGYRRGIDEYYAQAQQRGEIVIGIHLDGEPNPRFHQAAGILRSAGATSLAPEDDPTLAPAGTFQSHNL